MALPERIIASPRRKTLADTFGQPGTDFLPQRLSTIATAWIQPAEPDLDGRRAIVNRVARSASRLCIFFRQVELDAGLETPCELHVAAALVPSPPPPSSGTPLPCRTPLPGVDRGRPGSADVGIVGARGASASSEAADVVILADRLDGVDDAIAIAQRAPDRGREHRRRHGPVDPCDAGGTAGWLAPVRRPSFRM
jgi:hypothetical protein